VFSSDSEDTDNDESPDEFLNYISSDDDPAGQQDELWDYSDFQSYHDYQSHTSADISLHQSSCEPSNSPTEQKSSRLKSDTDPYFLGDNRMEDRNEFSLLNASDDLKQEVSQQDSAPLDLN